MNLTKLFDHMMQDHDILLTEGELAAIWMIVQTEIENYQRAEFPNAPAGMVIGATKVRCLGRGYTFSGGDMKDGSILLTPVEYELAKPPRKSGFETRLEAALAEQLKHSKRG